MENPHEIQIKSIRKKNPDDRERMEPTKKLINSNVRQDSTECHL